MTFATGKLQGVLLAGLLAAGGALGAEPSQPESMPAAAGRQAPQAAIAFSDVDWRLSQAIGRLAEGLAVGDEAQTARIGEQLLELQRCYLQSLVPYARDRDLEVRLRVQAVLNEVFDQSRVARMLAYLPPANRSQLVEFRRLQPRLFSEMLNRDWSRRVTAVRSLSRKTDPNHLAEPLIMLTLRHPSAKLVAEAAAAVIRCEYQSDGTVEALEHVLARFRNHPSGMYWDDDYISPSQAAMNALQTISTPRATCAMLKLLLNPFQRGYMDSSITSSLAEAVAGTGDKRAVPVLVDSLDLPAGRRPNYWPLRAGEHRGSTDVRDYALYAALKLTGQSPAAYGMLRAEYYGSVYIGFRKASDRAKAYDRMKQWWKAHRGKAPYERPPLQIPPPAAKAVPIATSAPATQPIAMSKPATTRPAPAHDELRRDLALRVRQLAEEFRATSFDRRARAGRRLIRLEQALLRPMAQPAKPRDPRCRKRVLNVLAEIITECNLHSTLCGLPADQRGKLRACQAEHPKATRAMFSLSSARRVEAMRTIAGADDPNGVAEPLVVIALGDPLSQVAAQAARVVQAGRYHSETLMDAITEAVLAVPARQWRQSYGNESTRLSDIARALPKVRNPRAVPLLVAIMKRQADASLPSAEAAAMLLAETGEKRLIASLLGMLDNTSRRFSWGDGKVTVTVAPCDLALMVMVKVSGQDPNDYGFIHHAHYIGKLFGFKDTKARTAAVRKFRQWWGKHKNTPPYKDLKPLSIPSISAKPQRHIAPAAPQPRLAR